MKRIRKKTCSRKGMAMMVVLFVVMAIAVIASGFIARSDAALQSGRNYCLRNEADYMAWAGLEHAKALIGSPDNVGVLGACAHTGLQLDTDSSQYYDLTINDPVEHVGVNPGDPSTYTYSIESFGYTEKGGTVAARSVLDAMLFYDPNSTQAYYTSVRR